MGMTISHFMWGYQPHYRVKCELAAKRVFESLDGRFDPEIFLVGILTEERKDRYPACVEPEEDFWVQSEDFNRVPEIAKSIVGNYPEINIIQSHPLAQERQNESLNKKSIRDAILSIVTTHKAKPAAMRYFVSHPSRVDCYLVSVVLGLQEDLLESHYHLARNKVALHEYRDVDVPISLVDAAIYEFLDKASEELTKPEPGLDIKTIEAEELLRIAGSRLMTGIVWKVDQNRIEGMHHLFRACTTVSALYYEASAGSGTIILARKEHEAIEKAVEFLTPYTLTNYRGARKLLELGSETLYLHCDSEKIYGLVSVSNYDPSSEDLFHINIIGHHHWELTHSNNPLMRVRYGQPYLPKASVEIEKLKIDLPRIFNGIGDDNIKKLIELVQEAEKERHGTMIVISDAAQSEANRLKAQGILLVPNIIDKNLLRSLTPIDGAVLVSPDCVCHAIGKGASSRGARYNSALRYVESAENSCMAIVVSEDGGIDLVPDLRPPIKRSDIDRIVKELRNMIDSEKIVWWTYSNLLDWLDEHRFYLLRSHCDQINQIRRTIEERLDKENPRDVKVIRQEYTPYTEMDELIYYIQE